MKRKMWPLAEQALFFTRLGRLLERGYPLGQALEFLAIQAPTHRRMEVERCLQQLRAGLPLFAAVEALSVDRMAVNLLFFAERHGDLPRGMAETGEALAQKARFYEQLHRFSRYPLFLLSLLIIMLVLMEWWLLPQFERAAAFSPQRGHTAWLLAVVAHAPMAMAAIAVLAVFSGLFYTAYFRRWPVSRKLQFALRIPGLASFLRLFLTCLTARQLGRLLQAGLSVYDALGVFSEPSSWPFLQMEGRRLRHGLMKGMALDRLIGAARYYEQELALVIRHGQSNGELGKELEHYSEFLLQMIEKRAEAALKLVQPLLLSVVGALIVGMYLAILLPMFSMLNSL
ncbi:competence type IV pilus assembly protein ComGB [Geobacillus stearothermophilus]|uniref:competence type IV pilus assembly protein ComGB n=1 Tax=Geobacillus stearothermophilus TaxID=1422 RepID=UPI002E1E47C8|nr:competence type IV pilus assembly protein ComGB [Geobacillus stearothermophilus]MED4869492.1 competence type IV pilus assembly protein ComGB [Geobacillus stearothermophilus]MED4985575.1 competence type IV pilus assembly protein ComGB [Geobacillus stearothermophilus]